MLQRVPWMQHKHDRVEKFLSNGVSPSGGEISPTGGFFGVVLELGGDFNGTPAHSIHNYLLLSPEVNESVLYLTK